MADLQIKRNAILHHHLNGKTNPEIFKILKNTGICRTLVHRTIKRYFETGSIEEKKKKWTAEVTEVTKIPEGTEEPYSKESMPEAKEIGITNGRVQVHNVQSTQGGPWTKGFKTWPTSFTHSHPNQK